MVGARSPVRRHDLIRLQRAVQSAYPLLQGRSTQDITVCQATAAQFFQEARLIYTAKSEQFTDRDRIHAGLRDIIPGTFFVGVHPFLNGKRADLHG